MRLWCAVSLVSYLIATCVAFSDSEPIPTIDIVGNKFFDSVSGKQFFIKGLAYQRQRKEGEVYDRELESAYVDSLAQPALCLKDVELFKELGINTVRVYQVDPTQNHDVCMRALANYGIYVLVDLAEPEQSINREAPTWDTGLHQRYTAVVDNMYSYPNVLGFIAGNEVVTSAVNTDAAAFVKAAIRDVKWHIQLRGYRLIPVGYASNDDAATRMDMANYFVCNEFETWNAVADFYALNMFEWCGYSSFGTSGYRERTLEFSNMPVPVFFSEFGCNTMTPRPFTEIELLFGPTMARVWSGGIIYEYLQHDNKYGLVEENEHGHLVKLEDFNIVRLRLVENVPRGTLRENAVGHHTRSLVCPATSDTWRLTPRLPPTPDSSMCECLQATLSCVVTPYFSVHETDLLTDVCQKTDCLEITSDASTGRYGKFASCNMRQRTSYALDKHWHESNKDPSSCNFDDRATLLTFKSAELDSISLSDGRTCRQAGIVAAQNSSNGEVWHALLTGKEASRYGTRRTSKAAAGSAHWGVVFMSVFVMSLAYLIT